MGSEMADHYILDFIHGSLSGRCQSYLMMKSSPVTPIFLFGSLPIPSIRNWLAINLIVWNAVLRADPFALAINPILHVSKNGPLMVNLASHATYIISGHYPLFPR